jgi:hypothetical protein
VKIQVNRGGRVVLTPSRAYVPLQLNR